jgi:hypothetical protein
LQIIIETMYNKYSRLTEIHRQQPFTLERGVSLCLEVSHHIEKVVGVLGLGVASLLDVPLLVDNTSMGGTIAALGPRGATGHGLPFVVRVVLQVDVWVFHLGR